MDVILSGPVLSIVLCIFAGLALRYALFYKGVDRRDDQIRDFLARIDVLQGEKRAAQAELRALRAEFADLEEINQSLQNSNRQLHDANRLAQTHREEIVLRLQEREMQLAEAQRQRQRLEHDYDALKRVQRDLSDQAHRQGQSVGEIEQSLREIRKENIRQAAELNTMRVSAQQLRNEREDLRRALHDAEDQVARLQEAVQRAEEQSTAMSVDTQLAAALREENGHLRTQLNAAHAQLEDLTHEHAQLSAKLTDDEQQIAELRRNVAAYQEKFRDLTETRASLSSEQVSLERQLRMAQSELDQLRHDLETVLAENGQLKLLCKDYDRESADMTQQLEEVSQERDMQASKVHGLEAELQSAQRALDQARVELDSHRKELAALQDESDRTTASELQTLQRQYHAVVSELQLTREESESLASELSRWREQYESLVAELNDTRQCLTDERQRQLQQEQARMILEGERSSLLDTLQLEKQRRLKSESELEATRRTIADVEQKVGKLAAMHSRCQALTKQLEATESQRKAAVATLDRLQLELADRDRQLADRGRDIERLRDEQHTMMAELDRERGERTVLLDELLRHLDALDQLRVDSQSLESLLERLASVQTSSKERAERLRDLVGRSQKSNVLETSSDEGMPHVLAFPGDKTQLTNVSAERSEVRRAAG